MTAPDRATEACLERTRSAVLNVMVAVGAGIAASGLILRGRDRGVLLMSEQTAGRAVVLILVVLIFCSYYVRRTGASRSALRDPETRAARFFRAHLWSAIVGALAIPLGFAYGWSVRPQLNAVAPFWVVAVALCVLAYPRALELEDFDTPIPDQNEPRS